MGFSILHLTVLVMIGLLWVVPVAQICRRAGLPWGLALLTFIPLLGVIALWILAFAPWPLERRGEAQEEVFR